jgi:hypothetical protein
MAITQRLVNFDEFFAHSTGFKVIVNNLDHFSVDDIEEVNNQLITVYDSDILSTIPSCDCGNLKGRYLLEKVCSSCGTVCKEVHEKVDPMLWLEKLEDGLEFINPAYWLMLRNILDKKIDYVRWMTDPMYNPPVELQNFTHGIKEIMVERSYKNFIIKLPEIIQYLMNHAKFKDIDKQDNLYLLLDMYTHQKDLIFSNYLPIINKKLFVMENTTKGKFINLAVSDVIDVVMTWIKINSTSEKQSHRKNASHTSVVISKLASLYHNYYERYITKKVGLFRKHVYGARSHFTFRSVITSIPGKHRHDEIWVPWAIGVTAFRPHLINKLVNQRKMTYKKASNMLFDAVKRYIPLIDELLQELINEAPDRKIMVLAQRN